MPLYGKHATAWLARHAVICSLGANATLLRGCTNYAHSFSMLDETGFYVPSMAHNALPRRPCRCISGYQGIILQTLNSFASRSTRAYGRLPGKPRYILYLPPQVCYEIRECRPCIHRIVYAMLVHSILKYLLRLRLSQKVESVK